MTSRRYNDVSILFCELFILPERGARQENMRQVKVVWCGAAIYEIEFKSFGYPTGDTEETTAAATEEYPIRRGDVER